VPGSRNDEAAHPRAGVASRRSKMRQTGMHAQHTQDIADEDSGGDNTDMYAQHTFGSE